MGVLGGIAAVVSVVVILAYRNYKYEQELDSLLWKIGKKHALKIYDQFTLKTSWIECYPDHGSIILLFLFFL